jgi:methionine-rich copper-binding protein CopC
MTPTSPLLRVVVRLVAAAALLLGLGLATSPPAGAHAVVVGTVPADKTRVEALPDRISIYMNAKPATIEGDPVSVFDPNGARIDNGDVRVEEDGQVLSVGVVHASEHPVMGDYEVVYRIISADSHIVAGTFGFHVHPHEEPAAAAPAPSDTTSPAGVPVETAIAAATAPEADATAAAGAVESEHWLRRSGPLDVRPELVLGVVVAVLAAIAARRMSRSSTRARISPPPGRRRVGAGMGGGRV